MVRGCGGGTLLLVVFGKWVDCEHVKHVTLPPCIFNMFNCTFQTVTMDANGWRLPVDFLQQSYSVLPAESIWPPSGGTITCIKRKPV